MSFGRRTAPPATATMRTADRPAPRTRRGGYWLGLLCMGVVSAATLAVMPFISQFRLNGAAWTSLLVPGAVAVANTIIVAAVLHLLVDLALRSLGWRRPWIYALACAVAGLVFYVAMALAFGVINPIFALYVAVWPAAVGGWVMGLYRC